MLHIQVCLHDSLDFTGVVWVPRQCCVDPQKSENSWETSGKRQVWTCRREKRQGGSRLNPFFLLSLHFHSVMEQWSYSPLPKNICAAVRKLCCFWGQSVMHCLVGFFFLFFHLDSFTFQHPEAANRFSARNCHLGKSLYSRSSQLTLTLLSEIVLLLFQVTPKIAT